MEAIQILAAILSIAASVRQLAQARKVSKQEALEIFRREASPKDRELLEDRTTRDAVIELQLISQPLLDQLSSEAKDCEDEHIGARKRAKGIGDRKNADVKAAECMCGVLRDIKGYNDETLPSGPFQNWWTAYSCNP